jgi:DNA-directed RNA polymerase specialized sigma24 family protein
MPIAQIAQTMGCSEGAVRTHIRRSLLALRAKLAGKIDV